MLAEWRLDPVTGRIDPTSRRELLRTEFNLETAVAECHEEANRYLRACLARVEEFPDGPERQSIIDMCTFVLERSY